MVSTSAPHCLEDTLLVTSFTSVHMVIITRVVMLQPHTVLRTHSPPWSLVKNSRGYHSDLTEYDSLDSSKRCHREQCAHVEATRALHIHEEEVGGLHEPLGGLEQASQQAIR